MLFLLLGEWVGWLAGWLAGGLSLYDAMLWELS